MTPEVAAFATVRVTLEKLRLAALDAVAAVQDAEEAGVSLELILEAIRMDATDWSPMLRRMQSAHDLLSAVGARTRLDMLLLVDDPVATEDEMIRYEIDQGFLAYHLGRPIKSCPYAPGDPASATWRQGWLEAKDSHGGS